MFKFFRLYNKLILVVGGCVLMVAFLVPQAVTMFGPERMQARESLGTAHGRDVTRGEIAAAAGELRFLRDLPLGSALITDDPLAWALIQADAADMGLYASDREAEFALGAIGVDSPQIQDLARQNKTTVPAVLEAVRRLLISEQYRQLVAGTAYRDPGGNSPSLVIDKLQTQSNFVNQQLGQMPEQFRELLAQQIFEAAAVIAAGNHRLSTPLLQHYVRDNFTTASGRVALITPDTDGLETPGDERLQEVFDRYRDALPGQGTPYPFGYRYPDRVKLQTLRLPVDQVADAIEIDYVDVLDAYKRQPRRFADASGNTPPTPSPDDARALTQELRRQRGEELAGRILAQVQSALAEQRRGLPESDGYYQLPENYEPPSWQPIIDQVRAEHGVTLQIDQHGDDWIALTQLGELPGIGRSQIGEGRGGVQFAPYVAASRELVEDPTAVPRSLRTQVGLTSKPLRGLGGDYHFFRLLQAQPSHAPASLDEVREQVVADAKTITAYETLKQRAPEYRRRVVEDGLDAAADEAGVAAIATGAFQKVGDDAGNPPPVSGVGSSRAFVDAAFALVGDLENPAGDLTSLPREARTAVVPLDASDRGPALALFVLESYEPVTRGRFEQAADQARVRADGSLNRGLEVAPLTLESIADRVGFDLAAYREGS